MLLLIRKPMGSQMNFTLISADFMDLHVRYLSTKIPCSECVERSRLGMKCQEGFAEVLKAVRHPAGLGIYRGCPLAFVLRTSPQNRSCFVQCAEDAKFLLRASYLEIYNEDIRDLLGADTKQKLEVRRSQCVLTRKCFNLLR